MANLKSSQSTIRAVTVGPIHSKKVKLSGRIPANKKTHEEDLKENAVPVPIPVGRFKRIASKGKATSVKEPKR